MEESVEIFISYADQDKRLLNRLETQLALSQRQGSIKLWHHGKIALGADTKSQIDEHLQKAEIILLLVSADFFASDRWCSFEMQKAMELHQHRKVCVIPIILRAVDWQEAPFSHLPVLPAIRGNGHTLNDSAFVEIVEGIKKVVSELIASKNMATSLTDKTIAGIEANVIIIDRATGKPIKKLIGHNQVTTAVTANPDATLLATSSVDASIKFWDARVFVTRSDEPHINVAGYKKRTSINLRDELSAWPEWWQQSKIDVPAGMIPNPSFGTCLHTMQQRLKCRRLLLAGAKGLDTLVGTKDPKTLGEWLEERGASLKARPTMRLDR